MSKLTSHTLSDIKDAECEIEYAKDNSDNFKIAAVVVTYNRLELLKICIDSLRRQTRKLDEIIIVNNSSTDGSLEWLKEQKGLTVITQENSGSAGGQYTGIKTAYEKGYDWILCTDDDAKFSLDYLEVLLKQVVLRDTFFLGGSVLNKKGEILINHRGLLHYNKIAKEQIQLPIPKAKYNCSNNIKVDFISYIGMFINSTVVKECGYPDTQLFLYHDDVEYCMRIRRKYHGYLVPSAIVVHDENYPNISPMTKFRLRKQFQIKKTAYRNYTLTNRNLFFIICKYYKMPWKMFILLRLIGVRIRRILLYESNRYLLLRSLIKSLKEAVFLIGYKNK